MARQRSAFALISVAFVTGMIVTGATSGCDSSAETSNSNTAIEIPVDEAEVPSDGSGDAAPVEESADPPVSSK